MKNLKKLWNWFSEDLSAVEAMVVGSCVFTTACMAVILVAAIITAVS